MKVKTAMGSWSMDTTKTSFFGNVFAKCSGLKEVIFG
jgi:hypothetical protein